MAPALVTRAAETDGATKIVLHSTAERPSAPLGLVAKPSLVPPAILVRHRSAP
jgi:hypothetical protein